MQTILLDGNIYDRLATDKATRMKLGLLVAKGSIRVIAIPVVVAELTRSPFGGVPQWFPVDVEPEESGAVGPGQVPDAIITHTAHALADLLVSEDTECRWRLSQIGSRCKALSYREFRSWLTHAPD